MFATVVLLILLAATLGFGWHVSTMLSEIAENQRWERGEQ